MGQVGPDSVGASEGFLGWVAYLGAANAGIPLSIIVKNYGWEVQCCYSLISAAPLVVADDVSCGMRLLQHACCQRSSQL